MTQIPASRRAASDGLGHPVQDRHVEPGSWTEAVSAVGSVVTPVMVAIIGLILARRQNQNQELLKARVEYYKTLVPDLNTLMCYMTFIGSWKDYSPPEIVELKRRLDHNYYCAAPLFSEPVRVWYLSFEKICFSTFGRWGSDAKIRSGAYPRRQAWRRQVGWDPAWNSMFTKTDGIPILGPELEQICSMYDQLIAALVRDLDITRARSEYTTNLVSLNAHAPERGNIQGANT